MSTETERERWRRNRRKEARKRWLALNQGATTCQLPLGPHARCGGMLTHVTDRIGRVALVCPLCERRKAGICRDCPRKVRKAGCAIRCPECRKRNRAAYYKRREMQDRPARRALARRSMRRFRAKMKRQAKRQREA